MLEAEVYPATTQKRVSRQAICAVFGESYDPVAWQDWRWQMRHRLHRQDQFERLLALSHEERVGLSLPSQRFAVAVTPPFSALMDHDDPHCPIRKRVIPREEELVAGPGDLLDPCGEDQHMVVEGLVHRYPGRVLLLAQAAGAAYCRSCTRWRLVAQGDLNALPRRLEAILGYLHAQPEVLDVLISGGHPLLFSDDRLDALLSATRSVPSVELVRVGSRVPGFVPQRITPELAAVLRKYRVGLSLHFSHPRELTPEKWPPLAIPWPMLAFLSAARLFGGKVSTMTLPPCESYLPACSSFGCGLMTAAGATRWGTSHLRTSIAKGLEIMRQLRGFTSGYAVPTYVVDAPGGGGKIPLQPETVVAYEGGTWLLRNWAGTLYTYQDPSHV